jgi:N-methylhydantoinase B
VDHDAGLTVTTDRVLNTPPWGLFGGKSGRVNIAEVHRTDGSVEKYRKISNLPLADGDLVAFEPGGGGGYGPPLKRDPEAVLNDILDEYVSLDKAREDYGVVISENSMTVDMEATRKLRREMSGQDGRGQG